MKYVTLIFLILSLCFVACDRESSIGAGLLGEDNIDISFTDTLDLVFTNAFSDSIRTFATDGLLISAPNNYRVGRIEDPIFGISEQQLVLCPNILNTPDFDGAVLDSLVLILPLDSLAAYGELNATHDIKVYRLDDIIHNTDIQDRQDTFYTTNYIEPNTANLIGETVQRISYDDSIVVYNPVLDSFFRDIPQVRIKLDDFFSLLWLNNENVSSDSLFQETFKGMVIESEPDASSFVGFSVVNLSSATTDARLRMYYTTDTLKTFYDFYLAAFKHNPVNHDYSGTMVEMAIEDNSDENLFIQATGGTFATLDLSEIKNFEGQGINYGEVELTINETLGDDLFTYKPNANILAIYENEDGQKVLLSDIVNLGSASFDGRLRRELDDMGNVVRKYRLKITDHLVKIKNGTIDNPIIELVAQEPLEVPRRVVLHGNAPGEGQAKLKLVVSEP